MPEIKGTVGPDTLEGGEAADTLFGFDGNDVLLGGTGDDLIVTGPGDDSADGGLGNDQINGIPGAAGPYSYYASSGAQTLLGGAGNDFIVGGNDTDTLDGGDDADSLFGLTGADLLLGGSGDDSVSGDEGADTLEGGSGHDILFGGNGDDSLDGGEGDDQLFDQGQGAGRDTLSGGDGDDRLSTYLSDDGDVLDGGAGNDTLEGGSGDDLLHGGLDQDSLQAGDGNDTLDGGDGDDILWGGDGNDLIQGSDGHDELWDQASGAGFDTLLGGEGDDRLSTYTSDDGDVLDGGDGNDTLEGGSGDDLLLGGAGDDSLVGDAGDDTLDGGAGIDLLSGGEGDDHYVIVDRQDRVIDESGVDSAEVSASFAKLPSTIESVTYVDGALPLPYWIDALMPDAASGDWYATLLGPQATWRVAFPQTIPEYNTSLADADGYQGFNADQQAVVWQALAAIEAFTPLSFVSTDDPFQPNTIAFAYNRQVGSAGYSYHPSESFIGSDVFLDVDSTGNQAFEPDSYALLTLVHEIGHALGLKHPFAEADSTGHVDPGPVLPDEEDSTAWTVMSYTSSPSEFQLAYSPLDIAALQYLYGVAPGARAVDDQHVLQRDVANFIWDGAGHDTIDAGSLTAGVTLFLEPGLQGFVGAAAEPLITAAGQVTVNFGTLIEDAVGSPFDDRLVGNGVGNLLEGGGGNDTLEGGVGDDTLWGGAGDDVLTGGEGSDWAVLEHARQDLTFTPNGAGMGWTVKLRAGHADNVVDDMGTDQLVDIENLLMSTGPSIELYAEPQPASVLVYAAGSGRLLPGVRVELDGIPQVTDGGGLAQFDNLATANSPLRATPEADSAADQAWTGAIGLADAVGILRMAVGLDHEPIDAPPGERAASLLRNVAADVDADGHVSLRDALAALRLVTGVQARPDAWVFVSDRALSAAAADPNAPSLSALPTVSADPSSAFQIGLVGVLRGDVDSSWASILSTDHVADVHANYPPLWDANGVWIDGAFGVHSG
jgi:Ca2+-binding RTX toxin-like protein